MVQKNIARELISKLMELKKTTFCNVLEIGCGTGFLTNELLKYSRPEHFIINDLVGAMEGEIEKITHAHEFLRWSFMAGDAEKLSFPQGLDLVVSTSTIQWFHNLSAFFSSLSRSMANGCILAFSTFGKENFMEIRYLQGVGLKYPSFEELKYILSPSFKILHCSEEIVRLDFETPLDALKHIKHTGVNSISDKHWNRSTLSELETSYANHFSNRDGTVTLTYHPIIMITQKK